MSDDNVKTLVGDGKLSRTILCAEEANVAMGCYLNEHVFRPDRQVDVTRVMKRGEQLVVEFRPRNIPVEFEPPRDQEPVNIGKLSPPPKPAPAVEVITGEYVCEVCKVPISARMAAMSGRCQNHGVGHE